MKYLIMPLARLLWVLVSVLFLLPLFAVVSSLLSLWHWDTKYLKEPWIALTQEFDVQDEWCSDSDTYWVHKNPIDFLLRKKTYKSKQNA